MDSFHAASYHLHIKDRDEDEREEVVEKEGRSHEALAVPVLKVRTNTVHKINLFSMISSIKNSHALLILD
jgi:hypothetical protein